MHNNNNITVKVKGIKDIHLSNSLPFVLIAGPCVLESEEQGLSIASTLQAIADKYAIGFVFKASFDKANRSSLSGQRGMGLDKCMQAFRAINKTIGCPIITDVHESSQCALVADYVDILQIPAFLCRQTDLLLAAAKTGKCVNIKKGQFLSPHDMLPIIGKIKAQAAERILICERGVSFGYNNLVSDMRSLVIMSATGYPTIFDATHSVQYPGSNKGASGGDRRFVEVLARAAVATGRVAGVFLETHPEPDTAPSDGPNMVPLQYMDALVGTLVAIDRLAKGLPYQDFSYGVTVA